MIKQVIATITLSLIAIGVWGQSIEREVTVTTPRGVQLSGTLTLPSMQCDSACNIAIIISGSGPTDRDGNNRFMVNNSLKMLAEGLAQNGIASLRYDKRGVGRSRYSKMVEDSLSVDDFARDVAAWVRYIHREESFDRITLIGHSEGAKLAGMAVRLYSARVDNIVILAGPGRPMDVILKEQLRNQDDDVRQEAYKIIDSLKIGRKYNDVPFYLKSAFRPSVQKFLIRDMKIDPAHLAREISLPLLIIQGTTDLQITMEDAARLKEAQPNAELAIIENMNHVLKHTDFTSIELQSFIYNNPSLPLHPELIPIISTFIQQDSEETE